MNLLSLGIDIALRSFEAALRLGSRQYVKAQFPNSPAGFRQLCKWLKRHGVGKVRLAVEATSTYAEALLEWMYQSGHEVYLLNAEQVAHYARSLGQRNKTDRADAVTIAEFITTHAAGPWRPPSAEQKTLRSLTRARYQLLQVAQQLNNQVKTAHPAGRVHLQRALHALREELATIGLEITRHLRAYPALGELVRRCKTCKGVGLITAATLIAELPPITPDTDPRTIAAWAGLTPRRRQSGQIELPARLSRKGNVYVRQALYMPALVAKRHNPLLHQFAERLAQAGKSSGAILGAVAHKMLRILVGLLRSGTDFDPNWAFEKN